jgi:hypothetical protein
MSSQEPATGPCPEPDASNPHFPPCFPKIPSNVIPPYTPRSFEWSVPFTSVDMALLNRLRISKLPRQRIEGIKAALGTFPIRFSPFCSSANKVIGYQLHYRGQDFCLRCKSRDSSVGIALGYGLDDRGSRVRLLVGTGNFSVHHRVQNGSGAHPASYPMGSRGSFPGGKAAGT